MQGSRAFRIKELSPLLWVGLLILVGAGIGIAAAQGGLYFYAVLAVAGGLLFVFLMLHPHAALMLLLLSLFSLDWLSIKLGLVPRLVTWLPEVIILSLLVRVLLLIKSDAKFFRTPVDGSVIALLLIGAAATVQSSSSAVTFLFGVRGFFKYVLLFYVLNHLDVRIGFMRKLLWLEVALVFLQVPVVFLQWYRGGHWDTFGGTLGRNTTGVLGLLVIFVLCIAFGFAMHNKKSRWLLPASSLLLIPVVLAEVKAAFFFIPVAIVFMARRLILRYPKRSLFLLVIVSLLFVGGVLIAPLASVGNRPLSYFLFSPERVIEREFKVTGTGRYNRLSGLQFVCELMAERQWGWGIGLGPGSGSESYFKEYEGVLAEQVVTLGLDRTQIGLVLIEFGPVGLALFLWMYYRLFRMNARFYLSLAPGYWKAISLAFEGILLTYVVGSIYILVWKTDVLTFTFWFMAAMLIKLHKQTVDNVAAS